MFGEGDMIEQPASDGTQTQSSEKGLEGEGNIGMTPFGRIDATSLSGNEANSSQTVLPVDTHRMGQDIAREVIKNLDKPKRKITEIRVFYDDGTFDTFPGK